MDITERLKRVFSENGIDLENSDYTENIELDSIQFISIVVDIETEFDVEIPEEFLSKLKLPTFNDYVALISQILGM